MSWWVWVLAGAALAALELLAGGTLWLLLAGAAAMLVGRADPERLGCGGHLVLRPRRSTGEQAEPGSEDQKQAESGCLSRHRNLLGEWDGAWTAPRFRGTANPGRYGPARRPVKGRGEPLAGSGAPPAARAWRRPIPWDDES